MKKPSILEIIDAYVRLRRSGKEYIGKCPFHDDRQPSFSVNPNKGLFHCFGCGESGDVIDFIMKLDGLSFSDACRSLGVDSDCEPRPVLTPNRMRAAKLAAAWVNRQRAKFNVLIAKALEQRDLADEFGEFDLAERFDREIVILREFYAALGYRQGVAEMLALRESIERITEGTPSTL